MKETHHQCDERGDDPEIERALAKGLSAPLIPIQVPAERDAALLALAQAQARRVRRYRRRRALAWLVPAATVATAAAVWMLTRAPSPEEIAALSCGIDPWGRFPSLAYGDRTAAPRPPEDLWLGGLRGNAERGKQLVLGRRPGCASCHVLPGVELPGNVGPSLVGYGEQGRSDEWVFSYIFDARLHKPDSMMPPWGTNGVLTPEQIWDAVAYLQSLKNESMPLRGLDDPDQRPARRHGGSGEPPLSLNPALFVADDAMELYRTPGVKGNSCARCHGRPSESLRGVSTHYPRWDERANKVLSLGEFLFLHAREATGHEWPLEGPANIAMTLLVQLQSNGMPLHVDTDSSGARRALERGRALMARKIGQLNLACDDCHSAAAGRWLRGRYLTGLGGQITHFPTWRTSRNELWSLRQRIRWCNGEVGANPLPVDAPEYGDIELYLASLSNGIPIAVPSSRH